MFDSSRRHPSRNCPPASWLLAQRERSPSPPQSGWNGLQEISISNEQMHTDGSRSITHTLSGPRSQTAFELDLKNA